MTLYVDMRMNCKRSHDPKSGSHLSKVWNIIQIVAAFSWAVVKKAGRNRKRDIESLDNYHDIKRDFLFHIDPSGRSTDELLVNYYDMFKDLYRDPINQLVSRTLNDFPTIVYLWNAGMLKFSNERADQFDILKRVISFKNEFGLNIDMPTKFLLRIDDFPRFDIGINGLMDFHDICKEFGIDYLIGVTPFITDEPFMPSKKMPDSLKDDEIDLLLSMKRDSVEFGLHGITHRTLYKRYHTESVGLKGAEFKGSILFAKEYLRGIGIQVDTYIPPFNTLDMNNYLSIKDLFKGITGGPEAIPTIGIRHSPTSLKGKPYIPVYHPFYDKCSCIAEILDHIGPIAGARIIPLAVHWSWEIGSKFSHFRKVCDIIAGKTIKWNELYSIY
ncbi:MAG: DUF2334 domain-containing protein [Candidatus Thermoplasmatota archaeon]|nr:DUF2334 domain-containing protein [Candidatus Thermoplasmatota archaeon]